MYDELENTSSLPHPRFNHDLVTKHVIQRHGKDMTVVGDLDLKLTASCWSLGISLDNYLAVLPLCKNFFTVKPAVKPRAEDPHLKCQLGCGGRVEFRLKFTRLPLWCSQASWAHSTAHVLLPCGGGSQLCIPVSAGGRWERQALWGVISGLSVQRGGDAEIPCAPWAKR